MYKIQTLNAISPIIYNHLSQEDFTVSKEIESPDAVIVRSASMLDMELPQSLLSIARAGAGYNNIPVDACTDAGICVFNTPGANANAVKELVLAGMLLAARDIVGGIEWARTLKDEGAAVAKLVEKGKGQFTGPEISGKTLAVLGLGAIGVLVANAATHLGMNVVGYDPFISVENAWSLSRSIQRAASLDALLAQADYVTIHIPLSDKTRGMFDEALLTKLKSTAVLLNFSRAELCDTSAVLAALASGKLHKYVTDFPTAEVIGAPGVISIPHLGASTPESEDNCAEMAASQTRDFLMHGCIRNAVNLPDCALPPADKHRITVIHKNIPNMLGQITTILAQSNVNIEYMTNKSRKDVAYTVVDVLSDIPAGTAEKLGAIEGIVKVRVVC